MTPITAPRTTRELPMPETNPSTMITCGTPVPTIDITVISSSSPGNASQASTNRCISRSSRPPTNPDSPPTAVATSTATAVAANPTSSDSRAP